MTEHSFHMFQGRVCNAPLFETVHSAFKQQKVTNVTHLSTSNHRSARNALTAVRAFVCKDHAKLYTKNVETTSRAIISSRFDFFNYKISTVQFLGEIGLNNLNTFKKFKLNTTFYDYLVQI